MCSHLLGIRPHLPHQTHHQTKQHPTQTFSPTSSHTCYTISPLSQWMWQMLRRSLDRLVWHNCANSIFPVITFNYGPDMECLDHINNGNLLHSLCAITALGRYNPRFGGHLILFALKLIIEFPPGLTILLPSGTMPHSNTLIQTGETHLSMTQYCAGGLIRWVDYGFQSVKSLLAKRMDGSSRQQLMAPLGRSGGWHSIFFQKLMSCQKIVNLYFLSHK